MKEKLVYAYWPVIRKLARFGCASIGVVYIMVGILALSTYVGAGQEQADEEGAMQVLMDNTFTQILLWLMVLGLLGYASWRITEAIIDPYNYGSRWRGIFKRIGIASTSILYGGLAFAGAYFLITGDADDDDEMEVELTATILELDGGHLLVGLFALGTAIVGIIQFLFAYKESYNERLHTDTLPSYAQTLIKITGRSGYSARGAILLVLSFFLFRAAFLQDAGEVKDPDGAFAMLAEQDLVGFLVMFLIAIGTILYGLFMFIYSYFYRFKAEEEAPLREQL
jgi:heme/copper-type cytochrome/quinol oxidase subunit 2